jgi:hypothetical protein
MVVCPACEEDLEIATVQEAATISGDMIPVVDCLCGAIFSVQISVGTLMTEFGS